jgi:hypothetical protein
MKRSVEQECYSLEIQPMEVYKLPGEETRRAAERMAKRMA